MVFHALTFARPRGRCWKPRPKVFNTSQGTWRMLMHWKTMFDRYYCIKAESICYILRVPRPRVCVCVGGWGGGRGGGGGNKTKWSKTKSSALVYFLQYSIPVIHFPTLQNDVPIFTKRVLYSIITKTLLFEYIENFTTKNWKFSVKNSDSFHISAQNIDCWYSLEPPHRGGSNEYPQSMFLSRNKKNNVYPCKPQFYYIKVGFKGGQHYIGMFSWWLQTVSQEVIKVYWKDINCKLKQIWLSYC